MSLISGAMRTGRKVLFTVALIFTMLGSVSGKFSFPYADESPAIQNLRQKAAQHVDRKEFGQAIADLSLGMSFTRSRNTMFSLLSDRARCYYRMAEWDNAIADCDQALKIDPDAIEIYYQRAFAFARQGAYQKADADFEQYIKKFPHSPDPYIARIYLRMMQGKDQEAHTLLEETSKIGNKDSTLLNNIAWFRATCPEASYRNGAEAVQMARASCERTWWQKAAAIDTLAAACAEAGDFDQAISMQERAIHKMRSGDTREGAESRLALYRSHKAYRDEKPDMLEPSALIAAKPRTAR